LNYEDHHLITNLTSFRKEIAMILVRDIFHLKFGKAKEAKTLFKESDTLFKKYGGASSVRYLTDLTGSYYTFVMESTYAGLAAYEAAMGNSAGAKELGEWYQKFVPLVDSGSREMFSIIN
jgi:hypothetical protein